MSSSRPAAARSALAPAEHGAARKRRPEGRKAPAGEAPQRRGNAPGPADAAPYHHGALHAALLAAAQDILESQGLEALSLRAAARAVGVSHAAPKNHFGDLSGLLSELAAIGFRQFADALRGHAGDFDSVGHAYVAFAREHPAMFLLMFRSERLDMSRPALKEAVAEARQVLAEFAGRSIGLPTASAERPEPAQVARMVQAWSMVHGFAMLLIDGRLNTVLRNWPEGSDWQSLLSAALRG